MGEIKSVKVDNWGVFFLQKLQNFFNKTDYCDLTLQFRDNSQLKVHRLVLSACTDYFNVLEQTCDVIDDALIMPNELQADVVVPIVNFMYTGTLEFELKMYSKLLRTAKEMNMTVLLKLLEAHRRTMEGTNRSQRPPSPKTMKRRVLPVQSGVDTVSLGSQITLVSSNQQQGNLQQRRILTTANVSSPQTRVIQTKNIPTSAGASQQFQYRQQIGSTSLIRTNAAGVAIKQETSPVQQQYQQQQQSTSPFEQLRKGYSNNKRPTTATFVSPPAKKPNIEDVKEFAEQQRMRKQIAAEYGDDAEYESILDDDIHNDDDDDETTPTGGQLTTATGQTATTVVRTQQQQQQQQPTTTITFKQDPNEKTPTIVVKDSSNSKMNHAKIISEVLRQYPHLVRGTKNIKLKIMPNASGQAQRIIVKKEPAEQPIVEQPTQQQQQQTQQQQILTKTEMLKPGVTLTKTVVPKVIGGGATTIKPLPPKPTIVGAATITTGTTATGVAGTKPAITPTITNDGQKRRIDSKTMHALIALGAENTSGPWLCLRCGVNNRPISIPSYRGFRRHLVNTHNETIDPALCEHCGWRSTSVRELHFHMETEHNMKSTSFRFAKCSFCPQTFIDSTRLFEHVQTDHQQQCIYCNKVFGTEQLLFTHMKDNHKNRALADGIMDYSDEEFTTEEIEQQSAGAAVAKSGNSKIKILSDISLPSAGSLLQLEPSSEAASLSTVASGIAASIGVNNAATEHEEFLDAGETKFVNADGNEMILTEEQRKEIMSQLTEEQAAGGVVMVINDTSTSQEEISTAAGDTEDESQDGEKETETEEDEARDEDDEEDEHDDDNEDRIGEQREAEAEYDDCEIFKEFTNQPETTTAATATTIGSAAAGKSAGDKKAINLNDTKDSDSLEWAENLISEHESAETEDPEIKKAEKAKKDEVISKKLQELTGDWSEDENEDDDDVEAEAALAFTEKIKAVQESKIRRSISNEKDVKEAKQDKSDGNKKIETIATPATSKKDTITTKKTEQVEIVDDDNEDGDENEAKEQPEEEDLEDDIDLALQSLHKEDDKDTKDQTTKIVSKDKKSIVATKSSAISKKVEKMEIDEEDDDVATDTDSKVASSVTEERKEKTKVVTGEKKHKVSESKKSSSVEKEKEKEKEKVTETESKDDIKEKLIADLLAEAITEDEQPTTSSTTTKIEIDEEEFIPIEKTEIKVEEKKSEEQKNSVEKFEKVSVEGGAGEEEGATVKEEKNTDLGVEDTKNGKDKNKLKRKLDEIETKSTNSASSSSTKSRKLSQESTGTTASTSSTSHRSDKKITATAKSIISEWDLEDAELEEEEAQTEKARNQPQVVEGEEKLDESL